MPKMKNATIFVGSHYVGKSLTINDHLKPLLGMGRQQRRFWLEDLDLDGYVLSRSSEEADEDPKERVSSKSHFDLLVLAARPRGEDPSHLNALLNTLNSHGFTTLEIGITRSTATGYHEIKAREAFAFLSRKD